MDGCPDLCSKQKCTDAPDDRRDDGHHAKHNVCLGGFPGVVLVMLQPLNQISKIKIALEAGRAA